MLHGRSNSDLATNIVMLSIHLIRFGLTQTNTDRMKSKKPTESGLASGDEFSGAAMPQLEVR